MSTCFAYSKSGQRCEFEAGHEGLHGLTITWSDEDCFSPTTAPLVVAIGGLDNPVQRPARAAMIPSVICASCEHDGDMHPDHGACIACDCRGYIG